MRFKIYYDKTLKMSPEKLASQVAHITLNLGNFEGYKEGFEEGFDIAKSGDYPTTEAFNPKDQTVIVLGLSHKKFNEKLKAIRQQHRHTNLPEYHVQVDLGLTEVDANTETAFGYIE